MTYEYEPESVCDWTPPDDMIEARAYQRSVLVVAAVGFVLALAIAMPLHAWMIAYNAERVATE